MLVEPGLSTTEVGTLSQGDPDGVVGNLFDGYERVGALFSEEGLRKGLGDVVWPIDTAGMDLLLLLARMKYDDRSFSRSDSENIEGVRSGADLRG